MHKNITTIFSTLLLALTVGFSACGSVEDAAEEATATTAIGGGCTAVWSHATICMEYRDIYSSAESTVESQCVSDGTNTVTWSTTGCSTDTAVGYCLTTGLEGQPSDATRRVYLYTEGADVSSCGPFGDTYVAL